MVGFNRMAGTVWVRLRGGIGVNYALEQHPQRVGLELRVVPGFQLRHAAQPTAVLSSAPVPFAGWKINDVPNRAA